MANPSIFAAFERMWQHVIVKFDKTVSVDVQQNFTEAQKQQARTNIGIGDISGSALGPLIGTTDEITPSQVKEAILAGREVQLEYSLCGAYFNNFILELSPSQSSEWWRVQAVNQFSSAHDPDSLKFLYGDNDTETWTYTYKDVPFLQETDTSLHIPVVCVEDGGTGCYSIEDTTYTTPRYRASALVSTQTYPETNGVINWVYE